MSKKTRIEKLLEKEGAEVRVVSTRDIRFDPALLEACRANACGHYSACWMCPPDVGEIFSLIERVRAFDNAIVFQTVTLGGESPDSDSIQKARREHNHLIRKIRETATEQFISCFMLGAGVCGGCSICAHREGKACRHPGRAVIPLEAAGIDATQLAGLAGLRYDNGANATTSLGMLLCR
jgi:predicted metal-binding protein